MATEYLIFSNDWFIVNGLPLNSDIVQGNITQTIGSITVSYRADQTLTQSGQSPVSGYFTHHDSSALDSTLSYLISEDIYVLPGGNYAGEVQDVYETTTLIGETNILPTQTFIGTLTYTYWYGNYVIGSGYTLSEPKYLYYPTLSYLAVTVPNSIPNLFTDQADSVDFNNLTSSQVADIAGGAYLYDSMEGNDTVNLPNAAAASNLGGAGVAFSTSQAFYTGDGNDTVTGGDLAYNVVLGNGNDVLALGNGNNTVSAGIGIDFISLGNGNNTTTIGNDSDVITLGSGNNIIFADSASSDISPIDVTYGSGINTIYYGNSDFVISSKNVGSELVLAGLTSGSYGTPSASGSISIIVAGSIILNSDASLSGAGLVSGSTITNNGTIIASDGLLTIQGAVTGDGTLEVQAGATLDVTGDLSTTDSDNFLGNGDLQIVAPLETNDTLEVGASGTLEIEGTIGTNDTIDFVGDGTVIFGSTSAQATTSSTFQQWMAAINATPEVVTTTVNGFTSTSIIDFRNQGNLTLSTQSLNALGVSIFFGINDIANFLIYGSTNTQNLEPIADGNGGTQIIVDTSNVPLAYTTPTDYAPSNIGQIDWNYIDKNEGNFLNPYVPQSGANLTVAIGVDLGTGLGNTAAGQNIFKSLFPNYQNDPNLVYLYNAIGLVDGDGQDYLESGPYKAGGGTFEQSTSVSITVSQANTLTNFAQTNLLKQLVAQFDKNTGIPGSFAALPGGIATSLMDINYNLNPVKLSAFNFYKDAVSYSQASPENQPAILQKLYDDMQNVTAKTDALEKRIINDADAQIEPLLSGSGFTYTPPVMIHAIPITPQSSTITPQPVVPGQNYNVGTPSENASSVSLPSPQVAAITNDEPVPGAYAYILSEDAGSPAFNTLTVPGDGASAFLVSEEVGGTWSQGVIESPDSIFTVDPSATALSVTPLDNTNVLTTLDPTFDLYFDVTFATSGTFSGTEELPTAACYLRGTHVATDCGEKPVESLEIGDRVMTAAGLLAPIQWIGRSSYDGRFIKRNLDVLPVCIRAGALAENIPKRDLWISPLHAMFIDGVLVAARDLINHVTIFQVEQIAEVAYFHIELGRHDVIIAEDAPSESFANDDNRMMFQNADEYAYLYPDAKILPASYCAPRVTQGYRLEIIRQYLAERASIIRRSYSA